MLKAFQADFEFPAIICIKRNKSELFGSVPALARRKTEENEVSPQTKNPTISNAKSLDLWSSRADKSELVGARPLHLACYNGVGSEKFTASELYRCPNLSYNEDVLRERSIA